MNEHLADLGNWFVDGDWPDMTCPSCASGSLRIEAVDKRETFASESSRGHPGWEAEWVRGFFTAVLRCQRPKCQEVTVAIGKWRVRERPMDWDSYYSQQEHDDQLLLQATTPPIPITDSITGCPEPVSEALAKASQVIWMDPSAAGNKLRLAVELALDAAGISRARGLKTHSRIVLLRDMNADAARYLEAVKWIGNQASHEDSLTVTDVLEAARILHRALEILFAPKKDTIDQRAREINEAMSARTKPKS